ncbi:MAG: hypothetical protein LQ345_000042 [Seirophora villosa]|nr:MAG: hypothetical protein LQ345_000042 [Seirophora villosa]
MSSFFTTPASQKKRKRDDDTSASVKKKKSTAPGPAPKVSKNRKSQAAIDESISGSGSEDDGPRRRGSDEKPLSSSDSESEDETGAQRRLRLAEQYLENIKGETETVGFDAEDVDRDLIAERLKEDVAATKGRLYRRIASTLDFSAPSVTSFRADTQTTTSIAVCPPFAYTVSKDITLIKWELPTQPPPLSEKKKKNKPSTKPPAPPRRRPIKLLYTRGNPHESRNPKYEHHTAPILAVAASADGKFVVTGGADKRLIIWSATDLKPLRIFTQHRDAVTGLAFRKGTNQLYSSSKDRTIKTWSLDELGYLETLFGHQDEVLDVAALALERCVSVGARDRTARLWKVVEESQLVFRGGGGGGGTSEKRRPEKDNRAMTNGDMAAPPLKSYAEGSIDRVAMLDEETFVTGSDNGGISLWSMHKKKPVFTVPVAHGLDPPLKPEEASAEAVPDLKAPGEPQPRWITALATVSYADLILSGSWDGWVRVWKVSEDKKRIEKIGVLGKGTFEQSNGQNELGEADGGWDEPSKGIASRGVINDIEVFERGERDKVGLCVVVAVGKEHRFGRWKTHRGRNGAVIFDVPPNMALEAATNGETQEDGNTNKEQSQA